MKKREFIYFIFSIFFWNSLNTEKVCIINSLEYLKQENAWDNFHFFAFSFPKLLESSANTDKILIILLPEQSIISPLAEDAPFKEAHRLAITWLSIFYRCNKIDKLNWFVIKIKKPECFTQDKINKIITATTMLKPIKNDPLNFQENLRARILSCEDLKETFNSLSKNNNFLNLKISNYPQEAPIAILTSFEGPAKCKIVVTGAAGFIGSHLVKRLLALNYQVIGLDNMACSTLDNIADILKDPNFLFIKHDVTIPFSIDSTIDGIIHLASLPSPAMYYRRPFETMLTGLQGTKNCLDLAREKKAKFLFSSTSEVYGDPEIHPQAEEYAGNVDTISRRAPYDQSKRGGETLTKLYFDRYHLDVRIARIFNTYGPNMQLGDGRVVTNFIRASLENKPMVLYGGGTQTRSFAYVDETVDGIVKLFETMEITSLTPIENRVFNIGNPDEFTIIQLAEKVNILSKQYLNRSTDIVSVPLKDLTDPKLRCPDIRRAQTILKFNPKINLEEGLKRTFIYFFQKYLDTKPET